MIPFPYEDENSQPGRRTVLLLLILANLLAIPFWSEGIFQEFGLVPARPEWRQWFASQFLHGGLAHLAGNMWFLWIFGDQLEARLGGLFLPFYLAGGVAAGLVHIYLHPRSPFPMIGASGAICAVMGAYFVYYPRARMKCLIFLRWRPIPLSLSALVFGALYLLWQFAGAARGASSVSHGAHLGGLGFGMLMAFLTRSAPEDAPALSGPAGSAPEPEADGPQAAVAEALAGGDKERAVWLYAAAVRRDPYFELGGEDELLAADALAEFGRPQLSRAALRKFLLRHGRGALGPAALILKAFLESERFGDCPAAVHSLEEALGHPLCLPEQRSDAEARLKAARERLAGTFVADPGVSNCWIFAESTRPISPALIARVAPGLGMTQAGLEARLAERPGVLFEGLSAPEASQAAEALEFAGVPVVVFPRERLVKLPEAAVYPELSAGPGGPVFRGPDKEVRLEWRECVLIAAAALDLGGRPPVRLIEVIGGKPLPMGSGVARLRWTEPLEGGEGDFPRILRALVMEADDIPIDPGAAEGGTIPPSCVFGSTPRLDAYVFWQLQLASLKCKVRLPGM